MIILIIKTINVTLEIMKILTLTNYIIKDLDPSFEVKSKSRQLRSVKFQITLVKSQKKTKKKSNLIFDIFEIQNLKNETRFNK